MMCELENLVQTQEEWEVEKVFQTSYKKIYKKNNKKINKRKINRKRMMKENNLMMNKFFNLSQVFGHYEQVPKIRFRISSTQIL